MKVAELDIIARIELITDLQGASRHATIVDSLVSCKHVADDLTTMNGIIARHETWLTEHLARVASALNLALVDNAVLATGTGADVVNEEVGNET